MIIVHHGDCLDVMRRLPREAFDSVVCDPPYHLKSVVDRFGGKNAAPAKFGTDGVYSRSSAGFMGSVWDGGDVAFRPETWVKAYDALKPGAYLAAFGGTRTFHRMACAIEDAGFEIRDTIMWVYGSGFPKSHDVSKLLDKAARVERKVIGLARGKGGQNLNTLARRGGSDAHDAKGCGAFGQGAKQIDVDIPVTAPATEEAKLWEGYGTALKPAWEPIIIARKPIPGTIAQNILHYGTGGMNVFDCRVPTADGKGRWPANVIHDGSDEVLTEFARYGSRGGVGSLRGSEPSLPATGDAVYGIRHRVPWTAHSDTGTAARFFYAAKATKAERCGSKHPTVKPLSLMRYICRLVTPARGLILDPFAGSGSTGLAARAEGFDAVLIERQAQYIVDIVRRLRIR